MSAKRWIVAGVAILLVCVVLLAAAVVGLYVLCPSMFESKPVGGPVAIVKGPVPAHGFLGVHFSRTRQERGFLITKVLPGSGAAAAGLQPGDVLSRVNDAPVSTIEALQEFVAGTKPGDRVRVEFWRGDQRMTGQVRMLSADEMMELESPSEPLAVPAPPSGSANRP